MGRVIFQDEVWERAPVEVAELLELVDPPENGDILDLACGTGRHALEFADRGYTVTGVDRTETYLQSAGERAESRGLDVEWVRDDMRQFRRPDSYDLAVSLYTSFGLFDAADENAAVLENLFASLREGGSVVIEVVGKEFIAAHFKERTWQEFDDGTLFLARREVEGPWSHLHNRWMLIRPDGERREFCMRHRLYSAFELREMVADAGFEDPEVYGGFDGRPYDHSSRRLVVVAEKR